MNDLVENRHRPATLALCAVVAAALLAAPALPLAGWLVGLPALAMIAWRAWRPAPDQAIARADLAPAADASQLRRLAVLGRLAPGIAHDFNNVLGVLSNSVYLFERHAGSPPPPALQSPLAAAQRAVKHGSRLTGQLQRFAEHRGGTQRALVLPVELQEVAELVRTALGRRFELTLAVASDARRALGDTATVELALMEAALDARQTLPGGSHLRLDVRNEGEQVRIALVRAEEAGGDAGPLATTLATVYLPAAPPA